MRHHFPALDGVIQSSRLGQWTRRVLRTVRTAGSTSQSNAVVQILRDDVSRLGTAERHRLVGIAMIVAAVTYYGLTSAQPPHQTPLAAPMIAIAMFVIGAALACAGDEVARAWPSSRVWSLLRRFMTSARHVAGL